MDIIFFAALAFFIFFRLSKHLGRIDEEEKQQIEAKLARLRAAQEQVVDQVKQQEKIVGASSTQAQKELEERALTTLDESTKTNLKNILQSCNITLDFFLVGAKSAFEMVIKSFSSTDLTTLKMLLAEKIYEGFEAAIAQRKIQENILTTNLISIDKSEIIAAAQFENFATITLRFVSKQINYITDKNGQILEGRKDEIAEITDIWTFKKDITSPNPNWIISATGS